MSDTSSNPPTTPTSSTTRTGRVVTATPPSSEDRVAPENDTADGAKTVAERATTEEGKNPAKLGGQELVEAAVKGELSLGVAPPAFGGRSPEQAFEEAPEAQNGIKYANVDEQFHVNWDLIDDRNKKIAEDAKAAGESAE